MKFPGRRDKKHYFPVTEKGRKNIAEPRLLSRDVYVVGIDQLLVDIEIEVDDAFLEKYDFPKGQSFLIADDTAEEIYQWSRENNKIRGEFPGGAVGNTLHNFAVLSDASSYALGAIKRQIEVGDYAFKYLSKTSGLVDMTFLQPSEKPMGRALCFITPDHERTFAISKGCMNDLTEEYIPEEVIAKSCALLLSAYTLRSKEESIYGATVKACEFAKKHNVPVVLSLGTSSLVEERLDFLKDFCKKHATILAMNQQEALSFTGIEDPLLALESILETVDMCLLTAGSRGLYVGAYCDKANLRETKDPLMTKSIVNYNAYEYSRSMRKTSCTEPVKVYTHVNPFKGGPMAIKNTNGAGDAALSALLHDISANQYHKEMIPNSPKHDESYLTYSSISQISKYSNRVSFEVLIQSSPRLLKGLPEKEDSLEEAHWSN
ncbi:MAG: inosine/guanosine kinase [Bacteriovoracaceae bacterium]|nr:inosine/guanosine kinase [Bacteriovoracaceae bacterium]